MTKKQEKKGRKEASAGGVKSIHHPGTGVEQRGLVSAGFQVLRNARSDTTCCDLVFYPHHLTYSLLASSDGGSTDEVKSPRPCHSAVRKVLNPCDLSV